MYFLGLIRILRSPSWRNLSCPGKLILIHNHGLLGLMSLQVQTRRNRINNLKRSLLSLTLLIRLYNMKIIRMRIFLIRVKVVFRLRVWQVLLYKVSMVLMVRVGDRISLVLLGWLISLFYCLLWRLKFFR